jgi:dienelactone hydrolase
LLFVRLVARERSERCSRRPRRRPALALLAAAIVVAGAASGSAAHPLKAAFATTPRPTQAATVRQIPVGVGSPPLRGTLTLPAGRGPFPAVVLVSGAGPNDQNETIGPNHPFLDLALGLAARGIATIRYDKRTRDYPASVNPRTFTLTQEYVPDALAAISLLRREPEVNPRLIFVLGHSQGGTYAPLIAKNAPGVAGVILMAAATESLAQAILRQARYLATLPGSEGAAARAQLPALTAEAEQIESPAKLEKDPPGTILLGGVGPQYFLSGFRYDEVATARSIPQPLLFLQGDRDYQVTVKNDLDVWLAGLRGRKGVSVVQFPAADHLFLDGSGPPTPVEYSTPGHVDPKVIATIAAWVERIAATPSG